MMQSHGASYEQIAKLKKLPKKVYGNTREVFRSSVTTLRRDSTDAESLWSAEQSQESLALSGVETSMVGRRKGSIRGLISLSKRA